MENQTNLFTLISIDAICVEGLWEWNDCYKVEKDIYFHSPSNTMILKNLRKWGYLSDDTKGGKLEVHDDGHYYVIRHRRSHKPYYALEPQW
tara:strand:- start:423 stop:695 length:273 start_codon:yes stop_codon:yes gene_type:complete